jgi:hypothetical protein
MISKKPRGNGGLLTLGGVGSRSGRGADNLSNGVRSCAAAKAAAWPDIHLRETGAGPVHEVRVRVDRPARAFENQEVTNEAEYAGRRLETVHSGDLGCVEIKCP